ncbi:MAG: hypothetical protein ACNI26_02140 [Terasakiella sp.]|uniref:hypothetical protein n=1 Tax=unclassified Terasakiella TaxID=2614952 RepID=UPI003B001E24
MFDLDKINETVPFLAQLTSESGNAMFVYIVLLGAAVLIGILIMLKILFVSMRRADQKCLTQFNEMLDTQE